MLPNSLDALEEKRFSLQELMDLEAPALRERLAVRPLESAATITQEGPINV